MKTKNRVLVAVVLCLAILVSAFAVTAFAADTENANLDIYACNLVFGNEVVVKYAIPGTQENARLLVWTAPQASYTVEDSPVATLTPKGSSIEGDPVTVFNFDGFNATQMTDSIYARAYDVATGEYGAVHKYSIIQYAYSMLGLLPGSVADDSETFKTVLTEMLEYGAAAQIHFNHRADYPAGVDTYVAVTVSGGTLVDGFSGGLFHKNESVTLTAPAVDGDGNPFFGWYAGGQELSTEATYTVAAVGNENITYTAMYSNPTAAGLAYTSNGDGTCTLTGMGDFTGTDLIIPEYSEAGDKVTAVSATAFWNNPTVKTVYIPAGVTEIEDMAFSGMDAVESFTVDPANTVYTSIEGAIVQGNTVIAVPADGRIPTDASITKLSANLFASADIDTLHIPANITSYVAETFFQCRINSFTVGDGSPFTVVDNCLMKGTILVHAGVNVTAIPAGTTELYNHSFAYNTATQLTVPASVKTIRGYTFSMAEVSTLIFEARTTKVTVYGNAFTNATALKTGLVKINNTQDEWESLWSMTSSGNTNYTNAPKEYQTPAAAWPAADSEGLEFDTRMAEMGMEGEGASLMGLGSFTGTTLVIPNTVDGYPVTRISLDFNETNIETVYIPASVIEFDGSNHLYGATSLKTIVVHEDNTTYRVVDGCLVKDNAVVGMLNGQAITNDPSVTEIGRYAFYFATIGDLHIPKNITTIADMAFYCAKVTGNITVEAGSSLRVAGNALINDAGAKGVTLVIAGANASIESGVQVIGTTAFYEYVATGRMVIPASVEKFGSFSFSGATLQELHFEQRTTKLPVGDYVFGKVSTSGPFSVESVTYGGTMEEWNSTTYFAFSSGNEAVAKAAVVCKDGTVPAKA